MGDLPAWSGAGVLRNQCAFTARDMSTGWSDAFTYAIVCGWGDAWDEVAEAHGWDPQLVEFLKQVHNEFAKLPDKVPPSEGGA